MNALEMNRKKSFEDGYTDVEDGLLSETSYGGKEISQERPKSQKSRYLPCSMTQFHLLLIGFYSLAFLVLFWHVAHESQEPKPLLYSPLNGAVVREVGLVNAKFDSKNPFKGQPSPELDHAWHSLFVNSNVRVTSQDLKKINRTSVPLGDGNGFYAIPDVYHQLHCLKFLRQMFYNDYYQIDKPTNHMHIDHCIDNLRQNIMCKGDVSLVTFDWVDEDRAPKPNFEIQHECRNWEKIDKWTTEHAFDIFDETTLVHPTLGPSFPEVEYKKTGKIPGHPGYIHAHGEHKDKDSKN